MEGVSKVRFEVTAGPDAGSVVSVGPNGARIGRASKNDIVLADPLLSRHHCRVFFKSDASVWVTDLGSANFTFVNGKQIEEALLRPGDTIAIGDSQLRLLPPSAADAGAVDLGFGHPETPPASAPRLRLATLSAAAAIACAAAVIIWLPRLGHGGKASGLAPATAVPQDLTLRYEKIQASTKNIFRYALTFENGLLAAEVDDLAGNRRSHKDARANEQAVHNLARSIESAGFFDLNDEYRGVQPNLLEQWDLTVTLGRRSKRVLVSNRVEPDAFVNVRQSVEAFGKNELGLWDLQYPAEKLVEMAAAADQLGRRLMDERDVRHGNLAAAIKSFDEAGEYLESVEPKPEFYLKLRGLTAECRQTLQERYENQRFLAEQATKVRDWKQAARELRVLCDMIPDRSDPRNQEARKKLLDVESRLEAEK